LDVEALWAYCQGTAILVAPALKTLSPASLRI
jgi:hypothetical protein